MIPTFIRTMVNPCVFAVVRSKQNFTFNQNLPCLVTCSLKCFYSGQLTPENIIASYEEVKSVTQNNNVWIIDVRNPEEITEHGKIPNSINIPLGDVSKVLSTMTEKEFVKTFKRPKPTEDSPIIFYCMIGKRSGMAQQNALNLGYKQVKNYLGSWTDWASKEKSM